MCVRKVGMDGMYRGRRHGVRPDDMREASVMKNHAYFVRPAIFVVALLCALPVGGAAFAADETAAVDAVRRDFNAAFNAKALAVNLSDLEKKFESGAEFTVETLAKAHPTSGPVVKAAEKFVEDAEDIPF